MTSSPIPANFFESIVRHASSLCYGENDDVDDDKSDGTKIEQNQRNNEIRFMSRVGLISPRGNSHRVGIRAPIIKESENLCRTIAYPSPIKSGPRCQAYHLDSSLNNVSPVSGRILKLFIEVLGGIP
jgi:hypothetical protein